MNKIFAAFALALAVLAGGAFAIAGAPSAASAQTQNWGAPIVFNFQAAKEQGIIAPRTQTLRTVKHSPTNPTLTVYPPAEWRSILSFSNTVYVQFPAGDPAYAAITAWYQRGGR